MALAVLLRISPSAYVFRPDETPAGHAMMLERIRQRLRVLAMGRNLAVALAAEHGSTAADKLQDRAITASEDVSS